MVKLLLIQITDETVQYRYFPEGKEHYGILSLNRANGDIEVLEKAENDKFNTYMHHAMTTLEKFYKNGVFPENYTVAWY